MNNLVKDIEDARTNYGPNTKFENIVTTLDGRIRIQNNPYKLEQWTDSDEMK